MSFQIPVDDTIGDNPAADINMSDVSFSSSALSLSSLSSVSLSDSEITDKPDTAASSRLRSFADVIVHQGFRPFRPNSLMAVITALQTCITIRNTKPEQMISVLVDLVYKNNVGWIATHDPATMVSDTHAMSLKDMWDICRPLSADQRIIFRVLWDVHTNLYDDPVGALEDLQKEIAGVENIWLLFSDTVLMELAHTIFQGRLSIGIIVPYPILVNVVLQKFVETAIVQFVCVDLQHFRIDDLAQLKKSMPHIYVIGRSRSSRMPWTIADSRKTYLDAVLCDMILF